MKWNGMLIKTRHDATHRVRYLVGHVVGLDGSAVICYCEMMDPFLVHHQIDEDFGMVREGCVSLGWKSVLEVGAIVANLYHDVRWKC